jgi:hypothetical protein
VIFDGAQLDEIRIEAKQINLNAPVVSNEKSHVKLKSQKLGLEVWILPPRLFFLIFVIIPRKKYSKIWLQWHRQY